MLLPLKPHLQRFNTVETSAFAHRARHPDIGEEVHVEAVGAGAFAGFAAAAWFVEAETAGLIAAHLGVRQAGKEGADLVEYLDISRRIGARRPAYRRLVYVDDFVDPFFADDTVVIARRRSLAVAVFIGILIVFFIKRLATRGWPKASRIRMSLTSELLPWPAHASHA